MTGLDHVVCLSIEAWDSVWRRNQHFASRLVRSGVIGRLTFVNPPEPGLAIRARRHSPEARIEVVTPPLLIPRRLGGHAPLGWWTRRLLHEADLVWVNDAVAGAHCLNRHTPAVYDVTDDWRTFDQRPHDRSRVVAAEDELSSRATTVVCSAELADRWRERYRVAAELVQNGVDRAAIRKAAVRRLAGNAPHAVYVGTLHQDRLDIDLVCEVARSGIVGTVHLVGPDHLCAKDQDRLRNAGVDLPGARPSDEVPSWLVAADVLICPHVVSPFTLSLDAIKSHEYLATDLPIVATPSSGFQALSAPGLLVTTAANFVDALSGALASGPVRRDVAVDWDDRAMQFGAVLAAAAAAR